MLEAVTIRRAYADDDTGLVRLAALDSSSVPPPPLVVAEIDGELVAAVSTRDMRAIADPFRPTAAIVELVRFHVERPRRAPLVNRLWPRWA